MNRRKRSFDEMQQNNIKQNVEKQMVMKKRSDHCTRNHSMCLTKLCKQKAMKYGEFTKKFRAQQCPIWFILYLKKQKRVQKLVSGYCRDQSNSKFHIVYLQFIVLKFYCVV